MTAPGTTSHALLAALHHAAIEGVSPFPRSRDATKEWLAQRIDSSPVHIFSLGKASVEMARGAFDALNSAGVRCAGGVIVAAEKPVSADAMPLPLRVGDHPLPDIGSLAAADAIANAVSAVDVGDDILVLLSGGTTSLCAAPCAELVALVGHPADAQVQIARAMWSMMSHGMAIHDMNALRRRLLRWGAGRLATALRARAVRSIHVLAISDVLGDHPSVIGSAPCTADPLSSEELLVLCDAHGLRSELDVALARALGLSGDGSVRINTAPPSHPAFEKVTYRVIASNADARQAAADAATRLGVVNAIVADETLQGDAEEAGVRIAQMALRLASASSEQSLLIWGGEPTVNMAERIVDEAELADDGGEACGGRMQALALAAALALANASFSNPNAHRISVLAAGTDGRDGPTDAAGAIIDSFSALQMHRAGRDPEQDLRRLHSYHALNSASALLRTGPTGTNVMDLVLVLTSPSST